MQQCLSLTWAARHIANRAVLSHRGNMPCDSTPTPNLPIVFPWNASAHVIPAIPLKPSTRITRANPPIPLPCSKRLAGMHTKIIHRWICFVWRKFRASKPRFRKFFCAVTQIFSIKYPKRQHLLRREFRPKQRIEIFSNRFRQPIFVFWLHSVVYANHNTFSARHTSSDQDQWGKVYQTGRFATIFMKFLSTRPASGVSFVRARMSEKSSPTPSAPASETLAAKWCRAYSSR